MSYILWLSVFVWFPTILLFAFYFNLLWKYKKTLVWAMFFALVFSIPWDFLAVKTNIWFFPEKTHIAMIGALPLEEYFFIIFVTLLISCLTIVIKYRLKLN